MLNLPCDLVLMITFEKKTKYDLDRKTNQYTTRVTWGNEGHQIICLGGMPSCYFRSSARYWILIDQLPFLDRVDKFRNQEMK